MGRTRRGDDSVRSSVLRREGELGRDAREHCALLSSHEGAGRGPHINNGQNNNGHKILENLFITMFFDMKNSQFHVMQVLK